MGKWIFLAMCAVGGVAGYAGYASWAEMHAAFEAKLAEYDAINYASGPSSVAEGELPYRSGKVLVIRPGSGSDANMGGRKPAILDESWTRLSGNVRATKPEEVATLIVVVKGADVHQTRQGDWIYQSKQLGVNLRVFDLQQQCLVGTDFIPLDADGVAEQRVAAYVESMPVR